MSRRFVHGGNISATGRNLAINERELLDFSANINPLGLASRLKDCLQQNFWRLEHYPDPENKEAIEALSKYHHCSLEELVLGSGAAELFQLLCLVLKPRRVVTIEPTYSGYAFAASLYGIEYFGIEGDPEKPFDFLSPIRQLQNGDLFFFCNPNNPTGRYSTREEVDVLVGACKEAGVTLVLDESFCDFLPDCVAPKSYIDEHNIPVHVIVVRSLTKILAVPGLRLGYLRADKRYARAIWSKRDPWSVNALAIEAAKLYPELTAYLKDTRIMVQNENRYLKRALLECSHLRVVSGEVNFLFISLHSDWTATEICGQLLLSRIMVRNCNSFPRLDEKYIRIAVRKHEENIQLIKALAELDGGE